MKNNLLEYFQIKGKSLLNSSLEPQKITTKCLATNQIAIYLRLWNENKITKTLVQDKLCILIVGLKMCVEMRHISFVTGYVDTGYVDTGYVDIGYA